MVYLIIALLVSFFFGNMALRGIVARELPVYSGQTRVLKGNNARWAGLMMLAGIILFDVGMMNYDNDQGSMGIVYLSLILTGIALAVSIVLPRSHQNT